MKNYLRCFLFAVAFLSGGVVLALAQDVRLPGAIDMMPNINSTINGAIGSKRAKILAGENRIKAGKASTKFVPTLAGLNALHDQITFEPDEPQTKEGQLRYIQERIARFEQRIRRYGLTTNDLANGLAVAAALSQAAYNDVTFASAAVQEAAGKLRADFLQSATVQSYTDVERQVLYGMPAIMAIQAIGAREKARAARTVAEKDKWERKAKEYARYAYSPKN